jgi:hypothetical protein
VATTVLRESLDRLFLYKNKSSNKKKNNNKRKIKRKRKRITL